MQAKNTSRSGEFLRWMPLDNAAKIYPAARSRKWSNVFRVSATLNDPIDRAVMQAALDVTVRRFPGLATRLRRNVAGCLFYRDLDFLSGAYVRTLDEGFENQLNAFWKDFLAQFNKSARDSMDPSMEDMALQLRRIRIITPGRSEAKI